ncbi:FecR family protein [Aquimarina sediminis]|uniref:FecR family protein n=1 Tax=Aquimarina sediminis TaxID=2070536 RepID=UPI000CA03C3E|nr:FecR domain-containing protein [Aquimarina sediminis]
MEKPDNTDDFLAKWASGELSEKEINAFKKSKDYTLYETILEGTKLLDVPTVDREQLFDRIKEDVSKEKKVIPLIPRWAYAAVASIALILGYTFFFNQNITHQSGFGEQLAVTLPDGSEAILNAKSKLYYKKGNWEQTERTVFLEGEAFFKVKKGNTFTVKSDKNSVSVLGTQFNVNASAGFFEVICYEGKVKVENSTSSRIITRGQAVRSIKSSFEEWKLNDSVPSWTIGESSFTNTPLQQVISALEKQYKITIKSRNIDLAQRYTGGFAHNNLQNALQTIFDAMNIKFIFTNNDTIELSEE